MKNDSVLFRSVDVWKRTSDGAAIRYRCFEALPAEGFNGGFCVQSADSYRAVHDPEQAQFLERNVVELFCEDDPISRSGLHPNLEAAIRSFDAEFE